MNSGISFLFEKYFWEPVNARTSASATLFFWDNQKFCASYDKGPSGAYYLLLEPLLRAKLTIAPFKNRPPVFSPVFFIKQRMIYKALDWMREHHLTIEDELGYFQEFEHITCTRVLLAEFKYFQKTSH
jgi:hypothetical protein